MQVETTKTEITFKVAELDDLPIVLTFVEQYNDGIKIDPTRVKNSLRELVLISGIFLIFNEDKVIGGIGGYVAPSLLTDDLVFNVMFFYVVPESRRWTKRIILEMELILLPTKATMIVYGIPAAGRMPALYRFFRMMKYEPIETHVGRRLS